VLSRTIPSQLPLFHCFWVGENNVAAKKNKLGKKCNLKKAIFRFYAKIAADTGFRSAASEQCKNTTNNKKSKLFKMLYWTFCQLFNLRILVRNFLDHWHYFFILITSKDVVGRRCENVLQLSDFFVFGTGDMIFDMWKMTKTLLKINKFVFVLSKKFSQFLYKYFHKLWDLGSIFCAEWIFLMCL